MTLYVIWSIEHQAWWPASLHGYVETLAAAGRFTKADAASIVADANIVRTEEVMIPIEALDPFAVPAMAAALERAIIANTAALRLLRGRESEPPS